MTLSGHYCVNFQFDIQRGEWGLRTCVSRDNMVNGKKVSTVAKNNVKYLSLVGRSLR